MIDKLNKLVHLLTTKRKYRNTSSRNGNHGNCTTDKSEVVARLHGSHLRFACHIVAVVVNGVDVYVRIGGGAIAVASVVAVVSVVASTRLNGSGDRLPAGIQSELRLCAVYISIEVIGIGAVLVSEPSGEGIAFLSRICRLCHFVTDGNKLRVDCRALVGIEVDGNRLLDTIRAVSISSRSIACSAVALGNSGRKRTAGNCDGGVHRSFRRRSRATK